MRRKEAPLVVRGKGASVPRTTVLTPFEVTNLVHGISVHPKPSAVDSTRVPDIIEFVVSPKFLDKPLLYPRQGTLLKIATLRDDLLTEYDLDLIGRWEDTFMRTGNEGISPGVLDRIRINKEAGRSWFREVDAPIGRRGGKGHIGALLGAYVLWNYMHRPGGPQNYYGIDPDKRLSSIVFAGKKEQAIANQWRDLTNTIASAPCFAPYISRHLGSVMTVMAPTDLLRIQKQQLSGVETEADPATFEILPSSSTLMAGRGPASFQQHFDEMAHIIATGSNRDAEAIYTSATPSLDQFGVDGFIYAGSSPWHMQGQFYKNCQQAVQMEEDGTPSYPEMLLIQMPSWGPYEDWERSESIPLVPPKTVYIDMKTPTGKTVARTTRAVRKYPYIKRPIQVYDDQMRQLERANPDTFKVERRSHWSESLDSYLNADNVRAAFQDAEGRPYRMTSRGPLTNYYAAHGDPAKVGDNFGFAIAHTEPGDESTYGLPFVVFDVLHAWRPRDFDDNSIDYGVVEIGLKRYIKRFTIEHLTFDQWNSVMVIGRLNEYVRDHGFTKSISIYERTATAQTNWREAETFKAALNMGLIKAPLLDEEGKESDAAELAELELRFLHEKNGRVDHQTSGPVQTKDVADCHDDQTEVLTELGWMLFRDVPEGVRVATRTDSGVLEYQHFTNRFDRFYEGPMIGYHGKRLDFLVTPAHRMLVAPWRKTGLQSERFVRADELKRSVLYSISKTADGVDNRPDGMFSPDADLIGPPVVARVGRGGDRSDGGWSVEDESLLSEVYSTLSMPEIAAMLPGRTRGAIYGRARKLGLSRGQIGDRHGDRPPPLDEVRREDFARFLGFWLAEGRKYHSGAFRGYSVRVSQTKPEGVKWMDDLVERLGWAFSRSITSTGETCWGVKSFGLRAYLMSLCHGSHELSIPDEVFTDWSRREMEALLEGLHMGDGNLSAMQNRFTNYTSTSYRLVSDVQRLMAHVGMSGNIRLASAAGARVSGVPGDYFSKRDLWEVHVDLSQSASLRGPSVEHYSGTVHCLTVPNGTLFTRRRGKAMWSGNSMMAVTHHLIGSQMGEHLKKALGTPMVGMSAQGGTNSPETRAGGRQGMGNNEAMQRMSRATRRSGPMGSGRGMVRRGR